PFEGGPTDEVLRRQLEEEAVPPSHRRPDREIPPELDRIVLRALHKDPPGRFASAAELARELAAVPLAAVPLAAPPRCASLGERRERRDEVAMAYSEEPLKKAS